MSAVGVDLSLFKECGECKAEVDSKLWETRIFRERRIFGASVRSAKTYQCPKCGNNMSAFIVGDSWKDYLKGPDSE